jgi:very-short-patch-repair endonuclease
MRQWGGNGCPRRPYHARRRAADARRDRALSRMGYRVLRLDAELVLADLPRAIELVLAALAG